MGLSPVARRHPAFVTTSEWMSMPDAVVMGFGVDPALTRERLRPYLVREQRLSEHDPLQGIGVFRRGGVRSPVQE